MLVKINVDRSEEWLVNQRLNRGENVPKTIEAQIDVCALSADSRRLLLRMGDGTYSSVYRCLGFDATGTIKSNYGGWGAVCFTHDGDSLTPEEVDTMLARANQEFLDRMEEARRREQAAKEQREREAAEVEDRKRAVAAARELLAEDLAKLKQFADDRKILADFISEIPLDAKRGTLKAMANANNGQALEELKKRIEDASPIWLFKDEDEDID